MSNLNHLRILIIDDTPEIHDDFIKILENESHSKKNILHDLSKKILEQEKKIKVTFPKLIIDTASQGEEGLQCVTKSIQEENRYALAFVDIRMPPGWDGIETIKHIWTADPDIQIVICTAYSDYTWEEIVGHLGQKENFLILKKPFDKDVVCQLTMALTKKWKLLQEVRRYTKDLESNIQEKSNALMESLSDKARMEDSMQFQKKHDSLTHLPNRELLYDFIGEEINRSAREMSRFAIMYFNIDHFKLINDSFSHSVGDEFLKNVADRIKKNLRVGDIVARLGGDEFVFIVKNFQNMENLKKIARKILDTFKSPFKIHEYNVIITPSIGISIFPDDGKTVEELVRNADMAMYDAKDIGGNQSQFYTEKLNQKSLRRLKVATDLHRAIDYEEFILLYQPQYDLLSNSLVSAEALIRWMHPTKGMIPPIDFIPLAEEIGVVSAIDEWVLTSACKQNKSWQEKGLHPIRMAVNVSQGVFKRPDLVEVVNKTLQLSQLNPEYLELELTENIIMNDIHAVNKITQLKELGIIIAIDDFGTGYSSLSYLKNIPLDRLKIDQSFIKNIDINRRDEIILQAIIRMAQNLNLEILAEGVETQKQLDFLKSKKCGMVQGFYMSKPVDAYQLEGLLRTPPRVAL